jgi:hypothetical protein
MDNPHHPDAPDLLRSQAISGLELAVLRALCRTDRAGTLGRALRELESYRWSIPEYRVVYQALASANAASPGAWRDELPAQTTRMGFPEVEWKIYLGEKAGPPETNLLELLRELKCGTAKQR